MTESDDNLFGSAVQNATGLAEGGIKKKTRQLLGTEDTEEEKKQKRRRREAGALTTGFGGIADINRGIV